VKTDPVHFETVKFLDVNPETISNHLVRLGFRKNYDHVLTKTLIFDHPNLRLRHSGKVLRLRQVGTRVFLSIKAGHENISHSPYDKVLESELVVDDFTSAFQLLESLGFSAFRYQEKLRTGFFLRDLKVEIDEYPKVPAYLEIQGLTKEAIDELVTKLGLVPDQGVKMSATEILRHFGLKDVDVIRFPEKTGEGIVNG
jgi:adenylate cyclase class 2